MKTDNLEKALLSAWLSPDERAEWNRRNGPADERTARAVERLAHLVRTDRVVSPPSDGALLRLAAHRAGLDPTLRPDFDREIASLLTSLPDGQAVVARWDALCARISHLDSVSDAASHFARLTGRAVDRPDRTGEPTGVLRLWRPRFWAAAAVLVTIGLTAALGSVTEDGSARAAYRSVEARSRSRTRGPVTTDRVTEWAALMQTARSRRLGLWPVYDRETLRRVEAEIVASGDSSSTVLFLLGAARLMTGSKDGGIETLREAASAGSEDARLLYEDLNN